MIKKIVLLISIIFIQKLHAQIHIGPGQTYANIQAASTIITPGDTVFVHAGSYTKYQGIISLKGTAAKPIVIMRYRNDIHDISGCWQFQACEHLTFRYLNFQANANATGRVINMDNNGSCNTQAKYIIFDSCYFSNVTDAASITAVKFGGCDYFEVTNCVFKNIPNCDALNFNVCHHGLISGNRFENCLQAGHIKGGSSDITMQRNTFINASVVGAMTWELGGDTGPQFYCPNDTFEVRDLRFYSNLIIGGGRGLALSSARNCEVINNTFYNCNGPTIRLLNTSLLYPKLYDNKVENNIFAFGANAYMNASQQQAGSTYFKNNIYYSLVSPTFKGPYWDKPEMDLVKEANPLIYNSDTMMFVDTAKHNFHLAVGSPAIATGKTETNPTSDYFAYIFKSPRSIGAVEYNSVTGIGAAGGGTFMVGGDSNHGQNHGQYIIYPNPSNGNINIICNDAKQNYYNKTIQIFSVAGELVYSSQTVQLPANISTKEFSKGIYIVRISGNDFVEVERLVVE